MRIRLVYIWWVGVILFAPSLLIWAFSLALIIYNGMSFLPFVWNGIKIFYLPLFAALIGFSAPLVCLWLLKSATTKVNASLFALYFTVMLIWGVIDVRHENYQMSYFQKKEQTLAEDQWQYVHCYFTWWFLPYRCIEVPTKRTPDSWWLESSSFGYSRIESHNRV